MEDPRVERPGARTRRLGLRRPGHGLEPREEREAARGSGGCRSPASRGHSRPRRSSSAEPAFSPDGKRLAFTRKRDAKGKPQLHVLPLDGGEARPLTELPLGAFDPRWLPDGSGIVFAAMLIKDTSRPRRPAKEIERREKDPVKAHITEDRVYRFWDTWLTTGEVPHLFLYDVATEKIRDLTPDSTVWFEWMEPSGHYDVSPDGREIAFAGVSLDEARSLLHSKIYTVPVAGGAITCLTREHPADDVRPRYTPDGAAIVYGMQVDPHFYADRVRVMRYDRATQAHTDICPDWTLSPSHWTFGEDGTLYLEAEEEARVQIYAWKGERAPEAILRGGTSAGVGTRAGKLFWIQQDLSTPPEIYTAARDGSGPTKVTRFTDPVTSQFGLGEVLEMQFEGAYGEPVQMFVVLPPDYQEGKQYPLVQVIHGGPHAISADGFHFRWNAHLFSAPGYISALVNFQGSTSWGQDFAERITGGWGDRPYLDVMKSTDALIATGMVDATRMAAAGGSYGGYMAAWIAGTHRSLRLHRQSRRRVRHAVAVRERRHAGPPQVLRRRGRGTDRCDRSLEPRAFRQGHRRRRCS